MLAASLHCSSKVCTTHAVIAHLALICGVQAASLWISDLLLSSPHIAPDLVTSYCTEKAVYSKIPLDFSLPHSNGKREFYFSRSSFHIINELRQHFLSGTSHPITRSNFHLL